ncbi:MAG: DUF1549 and DUF1553 domain-containing protein [Planctomycetota bacterium]
MQRFLFRLATIAIGLLFAQPPAVAASSSDDPWWSFQQPLRPAKPKVSGVDWPRNPIDRFVLARLEQAGFQPAPPADHVTLIRRASFDLTGLPPSLSRVDALLADRSPDAYERLIDELLASPHFGERWGRHWLDVARYADSTGGEMDLARPVWHYRDWVIDAFNSNLPFDKFIVWQVAGDLLPDATKEQQIATGFYRCGVFDPLIGNGANEIARLESLVDRVNTTGTAFLGLTLACAQCHDHKYDPISTEEYYQLFAFFNDTDDVHLGLPTKADFERQKANRELIKVLQNELEEYKTKSAGKVRRWELNLSQAEHDGLPKEVQKALEVGVEIRSPENAAVVAVAFFAQDTGHQTRREAIRRLESEAPKSEPAPVMAQSAVQRATHVYDSGDFHSAGEVVAPDFPEALGLDFPNPEGQPLNRLDLAHWLVDPQNPLTARVIVNRVWQHYFGRGLVPTENDFGQRGTLPTHPELLDWIAVEFVESGWDWKALHRLILTSATYQQSSRPRAELSDIDPHNTMLARQARLRLEAEIIRDVSLAAAGLLNRKLGGPTVFPYQPSGVLDSRATKVEWIESEGADRYRRGMYTHQWRLTPHPFYRTFDAPEALTSCTRRYRSNTPLQALTLLNDPSFVEAAVALADRVLSEQHEDDKRLELVFRLGLTRTPSPVETQRLSELLRVRRAEFRQHPQRATKLLQAWKSSPAMPEQAQELAAWTATCRAVMNLDEFITRE